MTQSAALELFHPVVREWFAASFSSPTTPQVAGWPAIARGDSTLILAPTGSGKTLTAFLWCLNRLMFPLDPLDSLRSLGAGAPGQREATDPKRRCRVLYVSPLKALAVDVERNLRIPLAGIVSAATAAGLPVLVPEIAIRTGDTPASVRARFLRQSADILITTPESLFLLLTSNARERLASVDTVIIDEIHALVPTKRGAHLSLSLERLERLRSGRPPLQRIGLSATQRPLKEVARFLGGNERAKGKGQRAKAGTRVEGKGEGKGTETEAEVEEQLHEEFSDRAALAPHRTVTIVDAAERKPLALSVEVPVEDMAHLSKPGEATRSIWASIHPRLLALIRDHRSTLLFVNSRRLAERLAGALNELAGELLVRAHHGSLARESRAEVEELLKAGHIRALVATSSLELGIDMGAIDLVIQIEAPPSVASGLQRIGRSGHQAGATSRGIIFPKFRGDLVACAAVTRAMHEGRVESTRYPRNPLDVLAQQIVAMASLETWAVDDLFLTIRQAAPFAGLSRRMFEGVLDMLSGRYPSDEFAELRPRVTWDRVNRMLTGREGAQRVAIANAGTIPDRGLYGVYLAGADKPTRVGELDEEMVFETHVGDTFTLGASTWRVNEITHDRVLVTPAPGEPGKMPFWHGDQAGRPVELGQAIGALVRELGATPRTPAIERLVRQHDLDPVAAENVMRYLHDQAAVSAVPDDRTVVIERCLDELGDWRVCLLSPFGSRIHAPWAMAATARIRAHTGLDVEVMWGDDGFVVRFPAVETAPDPALLLPDPDEVEGLVLRQLGATSLFAARFRETAARSLLLPRRRIGARTPLWQQRKRAADLLAVASRFGSFPALLETYREILCDAFDMPALIATLRGLADRSLGTLTIDTKTPSPFAASLLFSYVANYIYDGDAPLAERRAQALSVDQAQLRELLGDAELRDLLDADALAEIEAVRQHLDDRYHVRHADALHDLLIRIGDLSTTEVHARSALANTEATLDALERDGRIVVVSIGGQRRYIAVEDVARYRDALGVALPPGLPEALLEPVRDPAGDLALRYARSHGPFPARELAERYSLGIALVEHLLQRLEQSERLIEGEFRPGGIEREWVDPDVLRSLRRRSLAKLRREVEPVGPDAIGRFLMSWHGIGSARRGVEAVLDAIEQLQGAAIPASLVESQILPARVADYQPGMLDTLMAAGEVVWRGVEPLGERDGRVALFLTDHAGRLRVPIVLEEPPPGRAADILGFLTRHGASFFTALHDGIGGGFPQETVDALWALVWSGTVTNDTLHPLRAYTTAPDPRPRKGRPAPFRSRRSTPPTAEGRWALTPASAAASATEWATAMATQLLTRYGIVTRETVASEAVAGGFTAVYQVLRAMEEAGKIRRGYFVAGLGGAQFAMPAALDMLRTLREPPETLSTIVLAATDPANPYGTILPWPSTTTTLASARNPTRVVGAVIFIVNGHAAAYLKRGEQELLAFVPPGEPERTHVARAVARMLLQLASARDDGRRGMLIADINGEPASTHPLAHAFTSEGFVATAMGLQARPPRHAP